MKNNSELQKDVQDAIRWEPLLNAAEIGVTVKDGVVTLTGIVDCYAKKLEAENAAKNVKGVKALVENIEVKYSNEWSKSNLEIAAEILNTFQTNALVPQDKVKVKVEDGWVTLDGMVNFNYERDAAKNTINYLKGVKGVTNNIIIKSETNDMIEQKEVEGALGRNWAINSEKIGIKVSGSKITMTGTVHSMYQKNEAGRVVWNTPGVWTVENELIVED
jgi:osmotically-inducible protein OsmY